LLAAVSGRNGPFRRVLSGALRPGGRWSVRVTAHGPPAPGVVESPARRCIPIVEHPRGPRVRPGAARRASRSSVSRPLRVESRPLGADPLQRPSRPPAVRPCGRTSSREVPDPYDGVTRASPMCGGTSSPPRVRPQGFSPSRRFLASPSLRRPTAHRSRDARPTRGARAPRAPPHGSTPLPSLGPSPSRAFPSRTARSPLSGPLRPSSLVTGSPGATAEQ